MGSWAMMAHAQPKLGLRPFLPADAPLLAAIFRASIEELTCEDYSDAQQQAWASAADDDAAFATRLTRGVTLLGTLNGAPVGFASLDTAEHLDMLYVHPAAAGQGVGSMLLDAIERLAGARGATKLDADVSDSALEFFRRHGFVPRQRNTLPIGGEWLANTTMRKELAAKGRAQ
jgi:putative acetyltransferase